MRLPAEQYISQTQTNRWPLVIWLLLTAGSLLFVLAIIAAPIATATGRLSTAFTIYQTFHHLCHQLPERSFYAEGHPFAVCARCTGIYFGFFLAVFAYPLIRSLSRTDTPAPKWLFVAATPLLIDAGLTLFGIWENTHTSRLLTGALLGATAVFYVLPGLVDLALNHLSTKPRLVEALDLTDPRIATAPSDYSAPHRRI